MEKLKDIIKSYFCVFLITMFTKGKVDTSRQPCIVNYMCIHSRISFVLTIHWLPGINEATGSHHGVGELQDLFSLHSQAEFDRELPQNVSAIVGQTAFLSCQVRNLKPTQKVNFLEFLRIRSSDMTQYVHWPSFFDAFLNLVFKNCLHLYGILLQIKILEKFQILLSRCPGCDIVMSIFWQQESRPSHQTRDSPLNTTVKTSGFCWSNMSRFVLSLSDCNSEHHD